MNTLTFETQGWVSQEKPFISGGGMYKNVHVGDIDLCDADPLVIDNH